MYNSFQFNNKKIIHNLKTVKLSLNQIVGNKIKQILQPDMLGISSLFTLAYFTFNHYFIDKTIGTQVMIFIF